MTLVEAVTAVRLNLNPDTSFANPSEQLVFSYVKAVHQLASTGLAQTKFEDLTFDEKERTLAQDCFRAWELAETAVAATRASCRESQNTERAEKSPGPLNFWLNESLTRCGMTFATVSLADEALPLLQRALPLAREAGFNIRASTLIGYICFCLTTKGDYLTLKAQVKNFADLAEKLPDSLPVVLLCNWEGYLLMLAGQFAEAMAKFKKAESVLQKIGIKAGLLTTYLSMAQAAFRWGRLDDIEELINLSAGTIRELDVQSSLKEQACLMRAQLYAQLGNNKAATEQLEWASAQVLDINLLALYLRTRLEVANREGRAVSPSLRDRVDNFLAADADWDWRLGVALWGQELIAHGTSPDLTARVDKFEKRAALSDQPWELMQVRIHQLEVAVLTQSSEEVSARLARVIEFAKQRNFIWIEFIYLELRADHLKSRELRVPKEITQRLRELKPKVTHVPLKNLWPYSNLWLRNEIPQLEILWDQDRIRADYNRQIELPPPGPAREFLRVLFLRPNQTVPYETLGANIWPGEIWAPETHHARLYKIAEALREHFRENGISDRCLITVSGTGYFLRIKTQ